MTFFTGKNDFASGNQVTHTLLNNITDNLRLSTSSIDSSFALDAGQLSLASNLSLAGNPTATTQTAGNDTTRVATTAFVRAEIPNMFTPSSVTASTKSVTLPNGLIVKFSKVSRSGALTTIDFSSESADFPNTALTAYVVGEDTDATAGTATAATIKTFSTSELIVATDAAVNNIYYLAIGR